MIRRLLDAARGVALCASLVVGSVSVSAAGDAPGPAKGAPSGPANPRGALPGMTAHAVDGKTPVKISPETVLDMMYSSFNPVFQPAVLSRVSTPEQPVKAIENMRQKEFFQHAIAERVAALPWVKVTGDGPALPVCPIPASGADGQGWQRLSNSPSGWAGLQRY